VAEKGLKRVGMGWRGGGAVRVSGRNFSGLGGAPRGLTKNKKKGTKGRMRRRRRGGSWRSVEVRGG
jgi:hypothetical protein